jgi:Arylsulfotransferase (ASST)
MSSRRALLTAIGLLGVLALAACGPAVLDEAPPGDDMHLDLPVLDSQPWVERYLPQRASSGYNLELYQRRIPIVVDMNGRIVHAWPLVRTTARARLDRKGRLLVMGIDNAIKVYDWDGRLVWRYRLASERDLPHHDVIWLANGNVMVLAQVEETRDDYLQEVDRRGRVVWEWRFSEHLDAAFPERDRQHPDPTHVNSVHELGPNRWWDAGDARFRPGNLLLSARTLNAVLVVDRRSGEIVWTWSEGLDRQHEAIMVPQGRIGEGLFLVFNNGLTNRFTFRRSSVLAVDPIARSVAWEYSDPLFYSSIAGSQVSLPNGNLLITSSHGGRTFELTPGKEIVWQWIPPWLPMRLERYPYDHCPQLERLGRPGERPVAPQRKRSYIDEELHFFAVSGEYSSRPVAGERRQLVRDPNSCRELVIPAQAALAVGYGVDVKAPGAAVVEADFTITVTRLDTGVRRVLVEETVRGSDAEPWHQRWFPLPGLDFTRVELCLELATPGGNGSSSERPAAVIENPRVWAGDRPKLPRQWTEEQLSEQEQRLREEQLRAIGYIQ